VYTAIQQTGDDAFGGSLVFGLAEDGLDYSKSNPDELTSDIQERLDEFKQQIIDGEITVPETPSEA
jgi:basic membrane protein A